jgi:hypothetical protein
MPGKRTTMRKIRDVLRLRLSAGLSIRAISRSTKISVGGIQKLLTKASALELNWPLPDNLDDNQLANLFYPAADTRTSRRYQVPDWPVIHQELKLAAWVAFIPLILKRNALRQCRSLYVDSTD